MAIAAGRHRFGPENGRITLRTFRDGLAAQAGHDLIIEAVRWSGELVMAPDLTPASLSVSVDLGALIVRAGTGGIKPLTDRDKREIAATARKVLQTDRYPEATFTATSFEPGPDNVGGTIAGTLTLAGRSQPQQLQASQPGPGQYRATATIRQTSFGIKPYSGFLGALKVADNVEFETEVDLSQAASNGPGARDFAATTLTPSHAVSPTLQPRDRALRPTGGRQSGRLGPRRCRA